MKDKFMLEVSARLRELRANKKLTLVDVSEKSGLTKDIISRYENDKTSIQIDNLVKILKVYDTNLAIFFNEVYAKTQED